MVEKSFSLLQTRPKVCRNPRMWTALNPHRVLLRTPPPFPPPSQQFTGDLRRRSSRCSYGAMNARWFGSNSSSRPSATGHRKKKWNEGMLDFLQNSNQQSSLMDACRTKSSLENPNLRVCWCCRASRGPERQRRRSTRINNGENMESKRRRPGPWLWTHLKEKIREDQDETVQLGWADASVWLLSVEDDENARLRLLPAQMWKALVKRRMEMKQNGTSHPKFILQLWADSTAVLNNLTSTFLFFQKKNKITAWN